MIMLIILYQAENTQLTKTLYIGNKIDKKQQKIYTMKPTTSFNNLQGLVD